MEHRAAHAQFLTAEAGMNAPCPMLGCIHDMKVENRELEK